MLCMQCEKREADRLRVNRGATAVCLPCAELNESERKAKIAAARAANLREPTEKTRSATRSASYDPKRRARIAEILDGVGDDDY